MFKLLPEAQNYFEKAKSLMNNDQQILMLNLLGFYLLGIATCSFLNAIIHFFTSESIVHCVYEGPGGHSHNHNHGHNESHKSSNDTSYDVEAHAELHTHSHLDENHMESDEPTHEHQHQHMTIIRTHYGKPNTDESNSCSGSEQISDKSQPQKDVSSLSGIENVNNNNDDDSTPLIAKKSLKQKESLIDLSLRKLQSVFHKDNHLVGSCHGYDSFENCIILNNCKKKIISDNNINNNNSDNDAGNHYGSTGFQEGGNDRAFHYCELPSTENLLYFEQQRQKTADGLNHSSEYIIHSPILQENGNANGNVIGNGNNQPLNRNVFAAANFHLHKIDNNNNNSNTHNNNNHNNNNYNNNFDTEGPTEDDLHREHEFDHHHHITTPISRLLSIGLQTLLAVTLHKFPEGFITYSTSQANPELGLTIFLSLAIHNFVEGFTMCLPMYLGLNSRWKAITISVLLGSMSAPFGAVFAWLIFGNDKFLDLNDETTNYIFGCLMSLTSGFLTIIGFQMFASAIGFGGTQRFVLTWVIIGISLIGISYILIGKE
ncbi:hypothetical protein PACTADRAFT_50954 [Pachysolen tannophilus NRRL Y-2460]|uniref:Zinc/iron permease n=1 Tax=Pachysolen tannophilus NRRL Y-2460 TaxID=669874 RepID=A0A1E4TQM1_PACTA|nr:hypothetical protein PACTADRAFT_50954 [Pachysolen tannophilus NRRL Y-2460]